MLFDVLINFGIILSFFRAVMKHRILPNLGSPEKVNKKQDIEKYGGNHNNVHLSSIIK
jgi:hypothetical protein